MKHSNLEIGDEIQFQHWPKINVTGLTNGKIYTTISIDRDKFSGRKLIEIINDNGDHMFCDLGYFIYDMPQDEEVEDLVLDKDKITYI